MRRRADHWISGISGPYQSRAVTLTGVTARARLLATALAAVLLLPACRSDNQPSGPASDACGAQGTVVSSTVGLRAAVAGAEPGDRILLADGAYDGPFEITRAGTASRPITLCGSPDARLVGGSTAHGYTLHLDGASYWRLEGFSVTGGQKGVVLDGSSHNRLRDLRISKVGDEALHLRAGSSDNLVTGTRIRSTGLHDPTYGEGIYIGSAAGNWCDISDCRPDRSDRNRIIGNDVANTTAEAIDVKEGTTGGELRDNLLDGGSGSVDSVVDLKGNRWLVRGNELSSAGPDAVQVHVVRRGWGRGNRILQNAFTLSRAGYAVHLVGEAERADNLVGCDQHTAPAGVGEMTNVPCR